MSALSGPLFEGTQRHGHYQVLVLSNPPLPPESQSRILNVDPSVLCAIMLPPPYSGLQRTCEKCQKTFGTRAGWRYHTSHNVCETKPSAEPSAAVEVSSEQKTPLSKGKGKGKSKGKDDTLESTSSKKVGEKEKPQAQADEVEVRIT